MEGADVLGGVYGVLRYLTALGSGRTAYHIQSTTTISTRTIKPPYRTCRQVTQYNSNTSTSKYRSYMLSSYTKIQRRNQRERKFIRS